MAGDLIDFTMLARKGIISRAKARDVEDRTQDRNSGDTLDFTGFNSSSSSVSSSSASDANPLAGFFGAVDSSSSAVSSTPISSFVPSSSSSSLGSGSDSELNALRIKLDDNEFKLQQALGRIDELERKIASLKLS